MKADWNQHFTVIFKNTNHFSRTDSSKSNTFDTL